MKVRIKKGVKPYGGRLVEVMCREVTPKGRVVLHVNVGNKKMTIAHIAPDVRQYGLDEVEAVSMENDLDLLQIVEEFVNRGYCPHCGCDLWNTKGCSICPIMRRAYDALVIRGLKPPRQYAEYMEADEINKRNMTHGG